MALPDSKRIRRAPAAPIAWTGGDWFRLALLVTAGLTMARVLWLAAGKTDLYVDEAQYWYWSLEPALGYFSKPPLIAWVIAATTALFGDGEFGVRIAAPLFHLATALILFAIGKRLYDARVGCWSAIAYASLPAVSFSAVIVSTDVPLLTCWAAALYAFIRAREETGWHWWIVVGVACGVGLLAKYAMAYWILSAFLYTALMRDERRHLPRLAGAALLGLLVYSPNFAWNLAHGWVSYEHTRENANIGASLVHPKAFLEFLAAQFGVFGPVFFATVLVIAARLPRLGRRELLLASFALPTLAMMLVVSFLSRAQPNWSAPTYLSATVLVVAYLLERRRDALVWGSVAAHLVIVAGLFTARDVAAALGEALPTRYDALHRLRGWAPFGRAVAEILRTHPGQRLLADDREELSALMYYARPYSFGAVKLNPMGRVRDTFDLTTDMNRHLGESFIYVTEARDTSWAAARFASFKPLKTITIPIGPDRARHYFVYEADGFKGYR
jgi:4-amino-4-deoxy-L-arabinose transferase-like glycosyltransferase